MIKLNLLPAEQPKDLIEKADLMGAQMTEMLNFAYDNKGRNLKEFVAYFKTKKYSDSLINNFFAGYEGNPADGSTQWQAGFKSSAFSSEIYASRAIKQAIIHSSCGRCAYCESLIHQDQYGDVEHFRPKSAYADDIEESLSYPGYFWLAYRPENLLYSCAICNEAYKKNYFPIFGHRARNPGDDLSEEMPVFLNPYEEDPRLVIRFSALTGHAYPFDLVSRFYGDWKGLNQAQTEEFIWKNPTGIPEDYLKYGTTSLLQTDPEVSSAYVEWLKSQNGSDYSLVRGIRLIRLLGLNRPTLVRARLCAMRSLVATYLLVKQTGSEACKSLLNSYLSKDDATPAIGEYISCGLDTLQTCELSDTNSEHLMATYNQVVSSFILPADLEPPLKENDNIQYFIPAANFKTVGQRFLVYIDNEDTLINNHVASSEGVFLKVNWEDDLENQVIFYQGDKQVEQYTMAELLAMRWNTIQAKFKKYHAVVYGNYKAFDQS